MILVSGCLSGHNCSYSGQSKTIDSIRSLVEEGKALPVCPELLGGLNVPRPRSEIRDGDGKDVLSGRARVFNEFGEDITAPFIAGAESVLAIARKHGARKAILKARSPACGCGRIYDGTFTGNVKAGDGVTAALLKESGVEVVSEDDIGDVSESATPQTNCLFKRHKRSGTF